MLLLFTIKESLQSSNNVKWPLSALKLHLSYSKVIRIISTDFPVQLGFLITAMELSVFDEQANWFA